MSKMKGQLGEDYAADWLKFHGFCILARNYHSRYGEIDIIAENSQYIVFVEVKTREQGAMVSPLEAVTKGKQKKLWITAQQYLVANPSKLQPRFDLAAVTSVRGKLYGLVYYPNVFGI